MNQTLTEQLVKDFPTVFKDVGGDPRVTCMAWGLEVGDGWYDIIRELSAQLEPLGVSAAQVKEKFGTLRFYVTEGWTEEVQQLINRAERKSSHTCEVCGERGEIMGRGWLKVRCEKHEQQ